VAASLPLVAFTRWVLPGSHKATQVGYVAFLLVLGFVLGYALAFVRGRRRTKTLLAKFGYRIEPEGTIYAQLLRPMSDEGSVVIELKDGRRLWGCPRSGPQYKDDGINELYLAYPQAQDDDGEWASVGEGVIVPLAEVSTICLSEDPTDAPAQVA